MFKIRRQKVFYLTSPDDTNAVTAKKNIDLMNVTSSNVDLIRDFRSAEYANEFRKFLREGQYGIYAKLDKKVVGHAWAKICRKHRCRINGYIDIFKNEALIHCCNVSERHRGNNIYPSMLLALCFRLFYEAKVRRVLIDSEFDNYASLRGIDKVGFKPLGSGTYFQFRGRLLFKVFTKVYGCR